jgi:hypothetical protein
MAANEYLLGLLAIISGLAVVDLLSSLHHLFAAKARVRWDWLALTAATEIALTLVVSWWISWQGLGSKPDIDLPLWRFILMLGQLSALYMSVRGCLPDTVPDEGIDLKDYYARFSGYMWGAMLVANLLLLFAYLLSEWSLLIRDPAGWFALNWSLLLCTVVFTTLVVVRRRAVHAVLVPALTLLLAVSALGSRLSG